MTPSIRPVTRDNWRLLSRLEVRPDQRLFVASNLYSIAEAQFGGRDALGCWEYHPFGIYEDETPVGFLMYGLDFSASRLQAFIVRLMVDEKYQGKGYGRYGIEQMLALFRADERIQAVGISYEPENEPARRLYARYGFLETGELVDNETLARLHLRG